MTFDAAAVSSLFDQLQSHALSLGLFDRVATHEPKNAPGNGLSCVFWAQQMQPVPSSGLASTSIRVEINCRIYSNMLQEPQDAIDINLIGAAATLFTAYSGAFTLSGTIRDIDLLGQHGPGLSATAGYVDQDGRKYRVVEIVIPLIVNDAFGQVA